MLIENNKVVSIHYTLTNDAGEVLDSSEGREPLSYLHGMNNIISGLEAALTGKTSGESLTVDVEPAEGYGERIEELRQVVSREMFGGVDDLQIGMQFQAQMSDQHPVVVTVVAIDGDEVTIDGNHPLAGETLHFDVSIEGVRHATLEEISHGHVHGEHDHAH